MAVKLRQRKGKWWVFIDHNGKRKAKCVGEKKAAQHVAETVAAKLKLGELHLADPNNDAPARPFDAYCQHWLDTYVRAHCKDSTYANYETAFRLYLKPRFEARDISSIKRDEVKQLAYDLLSQPKTGRRPSQPAADGDEKADQPRLRSRSYVKAIIAPLSEMFNHAIEDGHLSGINPALRIFRRSRSEDGARHEKATYLTREELSTLLDTCRQHFPAWSPFVLLLARTGLRIGEAVALQWGDIDFAGRFAEVKRNLVDGHLTTPKSGKGRRVDLSTQLTAALAALQVDRKRKTLRRGWGEVPAWVFTNEQGNPADPDNFRHRVWPKLLEKAKLRRIRIHDLRHTYASLLIGQGESIAYVKDQMGHHSIRVTVDTYGHLVPGGNKAAVDRLDDPVGATIRNPAATSEPQPCQLSVVSALKEKWSRRESNPRPLECDSRALPTELRPHTPAWIWDG